MYAGGFSAPTHSSDDENDSDSSSMFFQDENSTTNTPKMRGNHKCIQCHANFLSKEMLKLHSNNCSVAGKRGKKDKNLVCEVCNKVCASPAGVKIHKFKAHGIKVTVDEKENWLQCSYCDYRAKFPSVMKKHEATHETGFVCLTCGEQFRSLKAKEKHEKMHEKTEDNQRRGPHKRPNRNSSDTVRQSTKSGRQSNQFSSPLMNGRISKVTSTTAEHRRTKTSQRSPSSSSSLLCLSPSPSANKSGNRRMKTRGNQVRTNFDNRDYEHIGRTIDQRNSSFNRQPILHQNFGTGPLGFGAGSAVVSHYAGMVINACAQSNLVTFHNVDTARGTIGQITFQFMCNKCRGERGVARCYRGRAYCVMCCGHPECD